jgi:tRNA1Val (adenine37-N6)-methyltransferase
MKPFHFQKFSINQNSEVFRVGTDAVLLGSLAKIEGFKNILEVGCGTGIISMMLAQRNLEANILAIDIDENAVNLAAENFKNSIFSDKLKAELSDFNQFNSNILFDLIVCNPPYFEANSSEKDVLARQKVALNFDDLIINASLFLNKNGLFSVIIPAEDFDEFLKITTSNQLYLNRKIEIFGIKGGTLKRVLLEFSKEKFVTEILEFTIEKSPRKYSEAYLELTKEFHLFGK